MVHIHDVISNTVSVIDGKTKTLVSSIPIGGSIVDVYVTDFNSNELPAIQSVISTGPISQQNTAIISATDDNGNPIHGGSTVTATAGTNPISGFDVCRLL